MKKVSRRKGFSCQLYWWYLDGKLSKTAAVFYSFEFQASFLRASGSVPYVDVGEININFSHYSKFHRVSLSSGSKSKLLEK